MDYSDNSIALIKKLVAEVVIRAGSYGSSNNISQSLGVCIRRITVAAHRGWNAVPDNIALKDDFLSFRKQTRGKRLATACKNPYHCYLQDVRFVLSSKTALPHLELLDWQDELTVPRSFFQCFPFTSIQHLRLVLDEEFEIELPKTSEKWPLRTLYLQVYQNDISRLEMRGPSTRAISPSILRLCSSTLESLTWEAFCADERYSFATYKMDLLPYFPRLRSLSLRFLDFTDYSVLEALLEGDLREVEIVLTPISSLGSEFCEKRGNMPALKTLVWVGNINDQSLNFLRENSQISKLDLRSQALGTFLDDQLLPLLTKSFRQLTSLSLHLEDPSIPTSVLDAISSLMTLQQLHLSAGSLFKHGWSTDHAPMRSRLKNLTSLKRMAFSLDTYDDGGLLLSVYLDVIPGSPLLETRHRESTSNVIQKLRLPEQG